MKQQEIERILKSEKKEVDDLKVPEELEERLRNALKKSNSKNKEIMLQKEMETNKNNKDLKNKEFKNKLKIKKIAKVAALIIAVTLGVANIDTLAFYGEKLIGYNQVMNDSLKKLNEQGKGQSINKSYSFKNGVVVTLDGAMIDDNKLIVFYTVKSPKGNVDNIDIEGSFLQGKKDEVYMKSSVGMLNEEKTEMKYKAEFEKPSLRSTEFKWSFTLREGKYEETGSIVFNLDANKAMGHTLKKNINQSIKIDQTNIRFKSIVASPTSTRIKGTIQNIFELAVDEVLGEGSRSSSMDVKLIANGKEVEEQGGGISTNIDGITFEREYDALPSPLKTLQIKLVSFEGENRVNEEVELEKGDMKKKIQIIGQNIQINKVYEEEGDTYVTITTEKDVLLSRVYMIMDGKKVELEETISTANGKMKDYKNNEKSDDYTRTLRFKGKGERLQLEVKRLKYNKVYNKVIDVKLD